jgi:uncharacterized protein (DUF486 family)
MKFLMIRILLLIISIIFMTLSFFPFVMAKDKPVEIVLSTYMPPSYGYLVTPL